MSLTLHAAYFDCACCCSGRSIQFANELGALPVTLQIISVICFSAELRDRSTILSKSEPVFCFDPDG